MKLKQKKPTSKPVKKKAYTRHKCGNCKWYLHWELMDEPTGVNQTITPGGRCQDEECHHPLVYEDDVCELWELRAGKLQVLEKAEQLKISKKDGKGVDPTS